MAEAEAPELKHIFCIDDDSDILTLARMALEKFGGFRVDSCDKGIDCIKVAEEIRPQLILLDVMMPDIDGPTVMGLLRQNPLLINIPVIFMTARVQPAEIDKYASLGAAGIIPKPFNPLTLPEDIRSFWRAHHDSLSSNVISGIEELRQQYLKSLSAKRMEIEIFWRRMRVNKMAPSCLRDIERIAHNLAGSGEAYGYRSISKSARVLEDMLESTPESPKLFNVTSKLLAAIDSALVDGA